MSVDNGQAQAVKCGRTTGTVRNLFLTKRELFAWGAMIGYIANPNPGVWHYDQCIVDADNMLAELAKEPKR